MTLTDVERITTGSPDVLREIHRDDLTIASFANLSSAEQVEWLELRRVLMEKMGWRGENGSDFDDYDKDSLTKQILLHSQAQSPEQDQGQGPRILAGMRLTLRSNLEETLSWSMLPNLPDVNVEGVSGRPVWDLTRLVPGVDMNKEAMTSEQRKAVLTQLFGAGLAACQAEGDENPCWVFTTYPWFVRAFDEYGMSFTPVPDTRRGGAQVYYAFPAEIMDFLASNQGRFSSAFENAAAGTNLA